MRLSDRRMTSLGSLGGTIARLSPLDPELVQRRINRPRMRHTGGVPGLLATRTESHRGLGWRKDPDFFRASVTTSWSRQLRRATSRPRPTSYVAAYRHRSPCHSPWAPGPFLAVVFTSERDARSNFYRL